MYIYNNNSPFLSSSCDLLQIQVSFFLSSIKPSSLEQLLELQLFYVFQMVEQVECHHHMYLSLKCFRQLVSIDRKEQQVINVQEMKFKHLFITLKLRSTQSTNSHLNTHCTINTYILYNKFYMCKSTKRNLILPLTMNCYL